MKIYKIFLLAVCFPFFMVSQQSNNSKALFTGCEELLDVEAQNKCTSKKVRQFFRKNINKQILSDLNLNGKQIIYIIFDVQEDGSIKDFKVRSSHKELSDDFKRIANLLPNFIPAKKAEIGTPSKMALSVSFVSKGRLDVKSDTKPENKIGDVAFSVIESVPVYPGCGKFPSNKGRRECMSKKIAEHVNKKFNTDIASDLGLEGRQRINIIFKISKTGEIVDIRARAPHVDLKNEAIRVIGKLPKMKPGMQKGKAVAVPYSLPIIFMVRKKKTKDPFEDPFFKKNG